MLDGVNQETIQFDDNGIDMVISQISTQKHTLNPNIEMSSVKKRARSKYTSYVGFKEVESVIQNIFQQSCNEMKTLTANIFNKNEDKSDIADELATMRFDLYKELDALTLILDKPSNISDFKSLKGECKLAFVEKFIRDNATGIVQEIYDDVYVKIGNATERVPSFPVADHRWVFGLPCSSVTPCRLSVID
ncbi:hypothetical protein Ddye_026308 [Dipteronia dyeriana]|uniref:Uncharacterized protein n=1 Tax=Dipteronia dyeriana TaxID=168575 RepID=A0AAD9TMS1_9ROSI|nr:hypothetical protein Ddye_026308 [Dipteronia dyeriana]